MSSARFLLNELFTLIIFLYLISAYDIEYLNGLTENEVCEVQPGVNGSCRKILDCLDGFVSYTKNKSKSVLKICKFSHLKGNDLICCPSDLNKTDNNISMSTNLEIRFRQLSKNAYVPDLLDFKTCRKELLKYRKFSINGIHFAKAMYNGVIPINKKNCDNLERLKKKQISELLTCNGEEYWCSKTANGSYEMVFISSALADRAHHAVLVERGNRPNIAAIGWTLPNGTIMYNCGGSIITERFIVTAAHCKYFEGVQADTVRLGDRFLKTEEDDDVAQQLKIKSFSIHPHYRSYYHYNDIAMIKTSEKIIFNSFVLPGCIDDIDSERVGYFTDWTVAGYGETENNVPSNVLLELKVDLTTHQECNDTYKYDQTLPKGIQDSQFCVKSKKIGKYIPDTCFGDSGSPLQFNTAYEVFHDEFNTTYLSTVYQTTTVLGIVSFGSDCGHHVPSGYTRLAYYKDWMRAVIKYF